MVKVFVFQLIFHFSWNSAESATSIKENAPKPPIFLPFGIKGKEFFLYLIVYILPFLEFCQFHEGKHPQIRYLVQKQTSFGISPTAGGGGLDEGDLS